jgi:hypothetical protein
MLAKAIETISYGCAMALAALITFVWRFWPLIALILLAALLL